jgi:hypothetical protein
MLIGRIAVALVLAASSHASAQTDSASQAGIPLTVAPDFAADAWVDANQPIGLRLSRPLDLAHERLAVVLERTDLSALFTVTPTVARYSATTLALPSGESELTAYVVTTAEGWKEIGRIPIRVRTRSGFRKADLNPALTLTTNGQLAPARNGDGSRRQPFTGVMFNPALTTALVNDHGAVELQSNFVAVTKESQALRFGNQGDRAPKFDLSDYLIKGSNGPLSASLGHVSFGSAKHLVNGAASRGITTALALGKIGELSFGALNGTSIVGWDNPLGLAHTAHRIFGTSLKIDAFTRHPGAAQFDISLLDAAQLPQAGFNENDVNDREKSRGGAFHVASKTLGDRVTLDAGYTLSRFANPLDPALSQGTSLVSVRPETKSARFADLNVAVLRDVHLSPTVGVSLGAAYRHERVDPLYRSIAAAVQANVLQNVLEISGGVGPLAFQASHARSEDNLDDLPSVLKTFTRVSSINASLPAGSLFNASKPSPLFPQLTWAYAVTHQFADGVPVNADFTETHAPDQVSATNSIDAQWALGKWKAGYRYNTSSQDNRQIGRENSDLDNLAHNIAISVSPGTWIDVSGTYAFERANNQEVSQRNATRRAGASLDLKPLRDLALTGVVSRTWTDDEPRTAETVSNDLSLELSQSLKLIRGRGERPAARLFMRYQRQANTNIPFLDTIRGDATSRQTWALNSGVSLNAF